jgi:hypothetical protein
MDALHRRALLNGAIAAVVTFAIGFGVIVGVQAIDDDDAADSPSPSATATTPPPPACTPVWELAQSADPGEASSWLQGVTALSADEAWAVGGSGDPAANVEVLIERWDGIAWTAEEGPSPGSQTNELLAVDAAEPNDVWAAGRTASGFGDRPLVLHYDGTQWLDVELPGEVTGVLTGVAAIAPDDVWVVGYTGDPDLSLEQALLLHWDGQLWAIVDGGRAVGSGKSALRDVEAVAADDVWAVGYLHNQPLIVHFDGTTWSRSETAVSGEANAIEPLTPADAWVAGSPIQRYDGTTWTETEGVRPDAELFAIAAVSPSDVWAVGEQTLHPETEPSPTGPTGAVIVPPTRPTKALVLRFDGVRWRPVGGQSIPGSEALTGIDALVDGTILAVGYRDVQAGRRTVSIGGTTCPPPA